MAEDEHRGRRPYEKRVESTEQERLYITASKLAVTDALNELFASFGVNRSNEESMEDLKNDLKFIRSLRKRSDLWDDLGFLNHVRTGSIKAGARFAMALITIFAAAFAWGLAQGFRDWINLMVGKPH